VEPATPALLAYLPERSRSRPRRQPADQAQAKGQEYRNDG
jgi:hypothetical protein